MIFRLTRWGLEYGKERKINSVNGEKNDESIESVVGFLNNVCKFFHLKLHIIWYTHNVGYNMHNGVWNWCGERDVICVCELVSWIFFFFFYCIIKKARRRATKSETTLKKRNEWEAIGNNWKKKKEKLKK